MINFNLEDGKHFETMYAKTWCMTRRMKKIFLMKNMADKIQEKFKFIKKLTSFMRK